MTTTYLGYQIQPVFNYSNGKSDFQYSKISDPEQSGLAARSTLWDVKEWINSLCNYPHLDSVELLEKGEEKRRWIVVLHDGTPIAPRVYHSDSFIEASKFADKFNALYFENVSHPNSLFI